MTLGQLYVTLLVAGLVLLVSIGAARIATRLGLPSLLLFLALGVLLGEDVIGIKFDNAQVAQNLGTAALAIILIEGGLTTRWGDIRAAIRPAAVLATLGVGVSTITVAFAAHLLLGFSWQLSLLLGATVSSTDAAAVFSILRVVPLPKRIAGLLEAESGFNDAPTVILVLVFSHTPLHLDAGHLAGELAFELAVGAAIGLAVGWLGALAMPRVALPASGLYPLAAFGLGIVAFGAAGAANASGFLAAYLTALVLANAGLPHRGSTRSFAEGMAWLAQIGLFVLLGLLVSPSQLPSALLPALVVGLTLLLIGRPLAVLLSLGPLRAPIKDQAFIAWAGLRGAVPVVLATFAIVRGVPDSKKLLNIVFVLVVVFTMVQGPTLSLAARWLGLLRADRTREMAVEAAPLDVIEAELLTTTIQPESRLHSVSILELGLPAPGVVTLIIRDGRTFVPEKHTRLHSGDEMLIVTTRGKREATERRLRAVSRRGRLAHWLGEYGEAD